jgi:dTDP-4-dehydrorhamnose reductase
MAMERSRTLLVGASGQVGTQLGLALGEHALRTTRVGRAGEIALDLAALQGTGQAAEVLDNEELDAVYCVGGMTHVDGCEAQPELARRTNAVGPGVLAKYARERGLPFVYFSTEYVFDGFAEDAGPYGEESRTHPLSVYGKSKLEGEQHVLETHLGALVLRTTVVYGPDPRGMNYLYSLMRNLSGGTKMRVPSDQVSTPTYNRDLVKAAMDLVAAGASGVLHVAGPERISRLEFAERMAERLGLDKRLLEGVPTSELGQTAPRPLDAGLATGKLRRLYPDIRMRGLDESLDDCAAELRAYPDRDRAGQAA